MRCHKRKRERSNLEGWQERVGSCWRARRGARPSSASIRSSNSGSDSVFGSGTSHRRWIGHQRFTGARHHSSALMRRRTVPVCTVLKCAKRGRFAYFALSYQAKFSAIGFEEDDFFACWPADFPQPRRRGKPNGRRLADLK